jgi:hypothetical protein
LQAFFKNENERPDKSEKIKLSHLTGLSLRIIGLWFSKERYKRKTN